MYNLGKLTIIGTSHISPESVKEVKKTILERKPEFVAIELDKGRLPALLGKKQRIRFRDVRRLGIRGFLFMLIGAWAEEQLGKIVKTKPGSEMKAAIFAASKTNSKIVLIDQDIHITINNLFKNITWREKWNFLVDFVKRIFVRPAEIKEFDLRKVPADELIEKLISKVEERYPSIYKALIHDRNKYMAKKLLRVMELNPKSEIIAIVGAGHVKGMTKIIEKKIIS